MAKIYSPPAEITVPDFRIFLDQGRNEYERQQNEYIKQLREWCQSRNPQGQLVGEIIRFGVADGYAQYMVASLRPVELIHIPLGDAWQFQYAHRLTAKDVRQEVARQQKMAKLFRRN